MMHRDMLLRQQVCVGRHPAFKLACSARTVVTSNHSSKYTVTYVNRSVHAEEHIEAPGSVVVRGDVAPNASIEATGDVMVWGRLSGHVHAGSAGDTSAVISALELRGAQLFIAGATNLGAARITVPGPHSAGIMQVGRSSTMMLTPFGPSHPPLNATGLTTSLQRWLSWYPAAGAALLTGCYALLAGLALIVAPHTVFGLLFAAGSVPSTWIQVGGVLFATFGAQYLGTALADYRQLHAASLSSSGCPDMPFRSASPRPPGTQSPQELVRPTAVAAAYQHHDIGACSRQQQELPMTAAMLRDSSSAYVDFSSRGAPSTSSNDGGGHSSGDGGDQGQRKETICGSTAGAAAASFPTDQLTQDQIVQLRQQHVQQHQQPHTTSTHGDRAAHHSEATLTAHQQHHGYQAGQGSPQQQQHPPTWVYCSAGFYEASVWSRLALAAVFVVLVVVCGAPVGLLVLAAVNLLGALSMWGALRRQWLMHVLGDMPEGAGAAVASS